ncbi:hypothetical protein CLOM_g24458 [Closterium sp. NIES-68]|nr:hypothetical protein CLOM_g24458 [Closterium sp. NIES-68]
MACTATILPQRTLAPVVVAKAESSSASRPLRASPPSRPISGGDALATRPRSTGIARGKPMGTEPHVNLNDVSEDEKERLLAAAQKKIAKELKEREEKLKLDAARAHLDHELKFGKMMFDQGNFETAMTHYNKVLKQAGEQTYHHGEATLQKAACLEKLGRDAEAKSLYESLIQFRAPYPNIKRRATEALFGTNSEQAKETSLFDDYMYRMFLSGFGNYMPKTKYVETKQEKMLIQLLPWTILAMAPLLFVWLMVRGD